jgi:hypothetical protein
MENLPSTFVQLILTMTGVDTRRQELAAYFDSHFREDSSNALAQGVGQIVEAKTIALVEDFHLKPELLNCFSLRESQNLLAFAREGELNVLVVREGQMPYSQKWSFPISSNFNLIVNNQKLLLIKVQARYDRGLDELIDLSIDKDEFDLEAYQEVLTHYTTYHMALSPKK